MAPGWSIEAFWGLMETKTLWNNMKISTFLDSNIHGNESPSAAVCTFWHVRIAKPFELYWDVILLGKKKPRGLWVRECGAPNGPWVINRIISGRLPGQNWLRWARVGYTAASLSPYLHGSNYDNIYIYRNIHIPSLGFIEVIYLKFFNIGQVTAGTKTQKWS